jgi:hypothetical protein
MAWLPLLFLAIDGIFEERSLGWCLLGIFAITMQILAGNPQYFFYTSIAAIFYFGFYFLSAQHRIKVALKFLAIYAGAFALGAAQILSGMQAAGECIRKGGVSFKFASMFSFHPENFITFIVPGFFGDNISFAYWGRDYLWEMSIFISITGFILALYGFAYGNRSIRRLSLIMIPLLLILALGNHTPLFRFLYRCIPGFNIFRGNSKFIFPASAFIIILAGSGLNQIISYRKIPFIAIIIIMLTGVTLIIIAICLRHSIMQNPAGLWRNILQAINATGESYLPELYYKNLTFIQQSGLFAAKNILIAGATCVFIALLFSLYRFFSWIPYIIALTAIIEISLFAKNSLIHFDPALTQPSTLKKFYTEHPGDYRILYLDNPNSVMSVGIQNILGHNPGVLRRYAEFIAFTQGDDPNEANEYLNISQINPLFRILRCRYVFLQKDNTINVLDSGPPMPRLLLLEDWLLITKRNDIFMEMQKPTFDPHKTVILEKRPNPLPVESSTQGSVKIIDSSTDHLTIEAELPYPKILLITDNYSKGWRLKAQVGSIQKKYEILPANYILLALPLSQGYHRFRLEYLPLEFQIGKAVSWISLVLYIIGIIVWYYFKKRRHKIYLLNWMGTFWA